MYKPQLQLGQTVTNLKQSTATIAGGDHSTVSLRGISGKRAFPVVFQIRLLLLGTGWRSPYCCLHPSFVLDFGSWPTNKEDQTAFFSRHPPTRNGLVRHPGHCWTQYAPDRVSTLLTSHPMKRWRTLCVHSVETVRGRKIWNIKSWLYVLAMHWVYIWQSYRSLYSLWHMSRLCSDLSPPPPNYLVNLFDDCVCVVRTFLFHGACYRPGRC